jgi:hypothetical protein
MNAIAVGIILLISLGIIYYFYSMGAAISIKAGNLKSKAILGDGVLVINSDPMTNTPYVKLGLDSSMSNFRLGKVKIFKNGTTIILYVRKWKPSSVIMSLVEPDGTEFNLSSSIGEYKFISDKRSLNLKGTVENTKVLAWTVITIEFDKNNLSIYADTQKLATVAYSNTDIELSDIVIGSNTLNSAKIDFAYLEIHNSIFKNPDLYVRVNKIKEEYPLTNDLIYS